MSKFLIAGAGIAGLSAAIALKRLGHFVTILEQATELSEVGAGIQLGPNAMRILMDWGLGEAILDKGCEPMSLMVLDAKDDRVLTQRTLALARQRYGAPHICIRRADLQSVLLQAALAAGAELCLGQKLTDQNTDAYDAVLGCDGIHSQVRELVLQGTAHAGLARATGHTAYRAMLDMSLLPLDLRQQAVQVWLGDAQHVVAYPVNSQQLNVVIAMEGAPSLAKPTSAALHTLVATALANGGFTQWPLFDRPPLLSPKHYVRGNRALLGDAAHPTLPYLAQGAAMAIEDADTLSKKIGPQPNIHMALQAYAAARWKRNAQVVWRSRLQGYAFHASGLTRVLRNAVLQVAGQRITDMPWLYSYQSH